MRQIKSQSHRNRGSFLERLLEMTHLAYERNGVASISKQHPEVTVLKMNGNRITNGFYKKKGEPDYIGVYDGRPLIFDAKQTNERTRFPLENVADHQYNKFESWHQKGAHAFLIVRFDKLDSQYLLPFPLLREAWEGYKGDGRKSIPYETFITECDQIQSEKGYPLHYLKFL